MTKITHPARAFARLVMMSRKSVHVVVEGKVHDRAFYDRVLTSCLLNTTHSYEIRLAEQVTLDGRSAGGKPFAQKLFRFFSENSMLEQKTNDGVNRIIFMLDRDYEHISGKAIVHNHLIYTETSDVEAEILTRARLRSAISSTYSLTMQTTALLAVSDEYIPMRLSNLWQKWIVLKVLASRMDSAAEIQHGGDSLVNDGKYGDFCFSRFEEVLNRMRDAAVNDAFDRELASVEGEVQKIFAAGKGSYLLKGKWIAAYIAYLIGLSVNEPVQSGVRPANIASAALESMDFDGAWVEHYRKRLGRIIAL